MFAQVLLFMYSPFCQTGMDTIFNLQYISFGVTWFMEESFCSVAAYFDDLFVNLLDSKNI